MESTIREVCNEALGEFLTDMAGGKTAAFDAITQGLNETLLELAKISGQQKSHAEELRRQIIDSAASTARKKFLDALEENLNKAFTEAMASLETFAKTSSDYEGILKALVLEALDRIGGADFFLQGNSRDQTILRVIAGQIAKEREIRLSIDSLALGGSIGGVIVRSADGFIAFDNTYEARIERMKPRLRTQIARLFTDTPQLKYQEEMPREI